MDLVELLQARIEETKRDLQDANERMQKAQADRDVYATELQGYERALAAEQRRHGVPSMPGQVGPMEIKAAVGDTLSFADLAETETGTNKAEFARQFVRKHAATGVTPSNIFDGFVAAGIAIKKPYIYSLVQRLQGQNAIKARRGKYYPAESAEQSKETVQ